LACAMTLISLSDSRFSDIFWSNSFGRLSSGIAEVARVVKVAQKERVEDDGGASGGRVTNVRHWLVPRTGSCPTNNMLTTTKMRLL
jgi:hypothetical protein